MVSKRTYLPVALVICSLVHAAEKPRLAVLELRVQGLEASAGAILTEWLQGALVATKAFNVVERGQVRKILDEADFQRSDCTESRCAVKAGRILNVRKVVIGSVGKLGRTYVATSRLVDVATGKVEREARGTHKGDLGDLTSVLEGLARQLAGVATAPTHTRPREVSSTRRAGEEKSVQLPGGVKLELVWIPPGEFLMGSPANEKDRSNDEGPQRRVRIAKGFWMGKYEVTQEQWAAVMSTRPWANEKYAKSNPRHAVSYVSWDNCQEFVKRLNTQFPIPNSAFRLPTEAEWEYACRAGTATRFYYGDDPDYSRLGHYAWYRKNTYDVGDKYAHSVGQKKPNAWDLYDMHGNVYEWCQDWYGEDYYGKSPSGDPKGPSSGSCRVLRGGSWSYCPVLCRAADRGRSSPSNRNNNFGFRIVSSPRGF